MKISNQSRVESRKSRAVQRRATLDPRPWTLDPRPSQRGIALVITLILLSVTLVMAVAFLAISNRERSSVTTTTDATTARLAAETALAQAESQIVSTMLATTNPYNYGLIVSTNYINQNGFTTGVANPENVNYDYLAGSGTPLSAGDLQQNIANLFLNPRVPVYIATNGGTDFRFYLDLNRNGRFDTNNFPPGADTADAGPTGDPEWIGVLERPDTTHGPNNKFLSRYAFIAVPVGNTLDVNYIHNQARSLELSSGNSGFFRNEGVGSWEINLAAFLTDLNTNQWYPPNAPLNPYTYLEPNFNNIGRGFEDALSILNYRYSGNYNTLAVPTATAFSALVNAGIDSYTYGNLMTNTQLPLVNATFSPQNWVGSDNTNHFFTPGDFFTAISPAFTSSLLNAGNANSTYDRYTFYRMLSQLGTDSTPESGLMNVNYDNLDLGSNGVLSATGTTSVTNFVPWTPIGFFTNAADRMLRLYTTNWFQTGPSNYLATYYGVITNFTDPTGFGLTNFPYFGITNAIPGFGVGNIPVLVNGQFVYSSAVNRVLQLAANMYDATTNNTAALGVDFPNVFKPIFNVDGTNVYITAFNEVVNISEADAPLSSPYNLPGDLAFLKQGINIVNIYGVPLIIGAKKGFPNFNQLAMQSTFQITRKLELTRNSTNLLTDPPSTFKVNQMFGLNAFNQLEVECWNSYYSNYTRITDIYVTNYLTMMLTNDEGLVYYGVGTFSGSTNLTPWPGYYPNLPASFVIPLNTNAIFIPTNSVYRFLSPSPHSIVSDIDASVHFETSASIGGYPQPHWVLTVTNNIQVIMVDHDTGRLIDYVQLSGPNSTRDLNAEIGSMTNYALLWLTNYVSSTILPTVQLPEGIDAQLSEAKTAQGAGWTSDSANAFLAFIGHSPSGYTNAFGATNLAFQSYSPTATTIQFTTWQANDPLVHYIASDLFDSANENRNGPQSIPQNPLISTTTPNERYQPWGAGPVATTLALKDPLIWSSDHWDFPTYKLAGVGWLGRVHRGTPWQTVYLKATNILNFANGLTIWTNWTGNINAFDAVNDRPTQDRLLFDLFTTAPNDNATRGQLSVNVGSAPGGRSLAAWSALFSGMMVVSNSMTDGLPLSTYHTIHPLQTVPSLAAFPISPVGTAGTNSPLWQVVTNINNTRENTNLFPQQIFTHKGDILATPQLAEQSPFLNLSTGMQITNGISDEMYEWLPQQAMSLLRAPSAPRYVIYCYGQALKPAPNGLVTSSGPFFQMITNYQVVTESAARAVIRVEGANTPSPHIKVESFNLLPPD